MERNYLFRGKTVATNEWIYGGIHTIGDRYFILTPNDNTYGAFEVDPETVGQFTGLRDKDDRPIFDGDIIFFADEPLVVYWNGETFQWMARKLNVPHPYKRFFGHNDWDYLDLGWVAAEVPILGQMTTQVGGNIYDNPPDDNTWEDVWF